MTQTTPSTSAQGPDHMTHVDWLRACAAWCPDYADHLNEAADHLEDVEQELALLASPAASPASPSGGRTGAEMIAHHRFRLADDGNCAEIDSGGLAEEIDAAIASLASDATPAPTSRVEQDLRARIDELVKERDFLTAALSSSAGPPVEPVAWRYPKRWGEGLSFKHPGKCFDEDGNEVEPTPLYAHPAPATVESDGGWNYDLDKQPNGLHEVAFDGGIGMCNVRICQRVGRGPHLIHGFPVPLKDRQYFYEEEHGDGMREIPRAHWRPYAWRHIVIPPMEPPTALAPATEGRS